MCLFLRTGESPVHRSSVLMFIVMAVTLMLLSGIFVRAGIRSGFSSAVVKDMVPLSGPLGSQKELGSVCCPLSFLTLWGRASLQPGHKPALRG